MYNYHICQMKVHWTEAGYGYQGRNGIWIPIQGLHVMRKWSCTAFVLCVMFISGSMTQNLWAQRTKSSLSAGEQRKAEKGLKDNKYFFYFIDSTVSNFGTEQERDIFKKAIQHDILAQFLYMKFRFGESYREIRKSQELLIQLYRSVLKRDLEDTMSLLNGFAGLIAGSDAVKPRHYLHLGYRDKKVAETQMIMADHYRDTLFSMRLYKYVRAIKKAKHGKRYAFIAYIYGSATIREQLEMKPLTFDQVVAHINRLAPEEKKERFLTIHYDNYYRLRDEQSFYDRIWDNPQLQELPEYKEYF